MHANLTFGLAGAAAAVVLAAASTVALAEATGGIGAAGTSPHAASFAGRHAAQNAPSCTVPQLPGSVVDVTLSDMGGQMMGGAGGRGYGGMMSGSGGRGYGGMTGGGWNGGTAMMSGSMSVQDNPTTVPAGTVSIRVANDGWLTHELVVLPLASGAQPGQRTIALDGTVSEDASVGEASATCAADEGDGIAAGSDGWVTLDLRPGRYELVCNLPGHYAAGMYAELDVTG